MRLYWQYLHSLKHFKTLSMYKIGTFICLILPFQVFSKLFRKSISLIFSPLSIYIYLFLPPIFQSIYGSIIYLKIVHILKVTDSHICDSLIPQTLTDVKSIHELLNKELWNRKYTTYHLCLRFKQ